MASPSLYLRSAIYMVGQCLSTVLLCPVMLLMYRCPFESRYAAAGLWVRFNLWLLKSVCGLSYEVHGVEHIPPRSGLIFCKHQSAFETIALQVIFPSVVFVLKRELLQIPLWGWAMATLDPIAIDRQARSAALKQILKTGCERIASGHWIALFPEGTRVAPGQRGNYGGSGGMLAQRAACPVVPVAHNAGEFWARNGFLKYPGVVQFHIGPALDGEVMSAADINHQAEDWIETRMAAITRMAHDVPLAEDGAGVS